MLPICIAGTEALFPMGSERLRQVGHRVVRVGRSFEAATLIRKAGRDRRLAMDSVDLALAALVPRAYRGAYGGGGGDGYGLDSARDLLATLYD